MSISRSRQSLLAGAFAAGLCAVADVSAAAQDAAKPLDSQWTDGRIAGQEVGVPTRRKYVAPEYPAAAAEQGIRGIVILEILIGETGTVVEARVTRSIPGLDAAALAAVRLWEYEPTKLAGKLVKVRLSQSITFTFKLPELHRAAGIPELKSGSAPPPPADLTAPQSGAVAVVLGSDGIVKEASTLSGPPSISEALLRVVKSWRFVASENAEPISFAIRADWTPGPQASVVLSALDPKGVGTAATATPAPASKSAPPSEALAPNPPASAEKSPVSTSDAPSATASPTPIATEVLTATPQTSAPEHGLSTIADVALGDGIPDLVKGRRPTWPPLARLGDITGEVVVRFSVDVAGKVTVHSAEGPEMLKASAEQAVGTWLFRRTSIDRLHLVATFKFGNDRSTARVEKAPVQ